MLFELCDRNVFSWLSCKVTFPNFPLLAHQPSPPSINLDTPSFKTVMMAESEVTATCVVHTALDAKVTWFIDGKVSPSKNKVDQASTTAAIISNLTVSTSQWKNLISIACKAEHRCFSSTVKTVGFKGRRYWERNCKWCLVELNTEPKKLFLFLSSRSYSERSISADQKIFPTITKRRQRCAGMSSHSDLLQRSLHHVWGQRNWDFRKTVCWSSCEHRSPFNH